MSSQFQLLQQRRFRPLFMTQFLGAFNDNVFKTALITLVAFHTSQLTNANSSTLVTILPGIFILPFFLFSATAGQIADKLEKSTLIKNIKLFEIFIMLFASIGFLFNNIIILGVALFFMGIQSAIFGPVKYAYLPQHLKDDELIGGNGMLEMGTFVAILVGQILGAWLTTQETSAIITSIFVILLAAAGYWSSLDIPNSPPGAPQLIINWNPFTETLNNLKFIWQHQSLWLAIIGISWFWFVGATLLAQFPNFARSTLHGDESVFILMLSVFSLGIGIGSLSCEKLSRHKIELGLVLFGGIGLIIFCADLYASSTRINATLAASLNTRTYIEFLSITSHYQLLADILFVGIFGGFYIVPLYAYIQSHVEKSHQSRVIAGNNIMNALFMVISAIFSLLIFNFGYSIPELFLATATISSIVITYLSIRQPAYLSSFLQWIKAIHFK
ncbi:MAG: MFS transporter [Methylotenera sp.]